MRGHIDRGRRPRPVSFGILTVATGLVALLALAACQSAPAAPGGGPGRSITLLAVNDIYRIEGLAGGQVGGLARLRALRAELEAAAPGRVLMLHAGDVIFPSLLSRMYQGRQMIDVLNLLDGDPTPGRTDERLFVVFGNHEFDDRSCGPASPLQLRVAESDFFWLHSNIALTPCPDRQPALLGANLLQARIVEIGGLRVGLFGLTLDTPRAPVTFIDPLATAAALAADLRRRGAEIVIAVTHLPHEEDERIYAALREAGLDLIIGGHEHEHMQLPPDAPRIFKADADAATAWVITLRLPADGRLHVVPSLRVVGPAVRPDPAVAARVAWWLAEHEKAFCERDGKPPGCLSQPLATAQTRLVAEEEKIRASETSLGNWVTDVMRDAFTPCGAEAAIINAGSLRLNHDLPAGTVITRRHVEELMQYPTPLYLVELSGEQLLRAMTNAISHPGAGRWLQVSGLAFVHDPDRRQITRLFVAPAGGRAAVDVMQHPAQRFRVVVSEFLTTGVEDGYVGILPPISQALPCPASGSDLKSLVYRALETQGTIAPRIEGRICTTAAPTGGCQADAWVRGAAR